MQEELEAALATVLREPVKLTVAGRTDTGVHARGQVASHPGAPAPAVALNGVLARDVRVLASEAAPEGFDARADARSRTYRYRIQTGSVARVFERGRALHWYRPLDRARLEECAAMLPGTHDFTAFTPSRTDHVRFRRDVLRAEWVDEEEDVLAFWIEANTFMRRMVRNLVGTMLDVSAGRIEADTFRDLLCGAPRREGGETAPPHGLYLESVRY